MDKLIDYICGELEDLERKAEKSKLSMAEMQYVDMLAHAKKNLLKGDEMMDGEYSGRYDNRMMGTSYENRERMGGESYARGRGRNARRDSRGRYSNGRYMMDAGDMVEELRELMEDAPDERTRMEFQRFIQKMEQM